MKPCFNHVLTCLTMFYALGKTCLTQCLTKKWTRTKSIISQEKNDVGRQMDPACFDAQNPFWLLGNNPSTIGILIIWILY